MKGRIMKLLLAILVMLGISVGWAAEKPAAPKTASFKGKILEFKDVENYTYLLLKTKDGETWAAVARTPVKNGADVTIENAMVMNNFESKSLKKTFDKIVFGTLGVAGASAAGAGGDMAAAHSGVARAADVRDVKVPKASGPDARTVAEIVTKRAELKDKTILVRGKVVKYTREVLGNNWVHLQLPPAGLNVLAHCSECRWFVTGGDCLQYVAVFLCCAADAPPDHVDQVERGFGP